MSKLTGGKEVVHPSLDLAKLDVETGGDDTALVQAANQVNNDLASSSVVNQFELANVALEQKHVTIATPRNGNAITVDYSLINYNT